MIYRTFDDLCRAASEALNRLPQPLTREAILADPDLMEVARLIEIYLDAESNPLEGVIGVGCITYAERMMQAAQSV